MAKLVFNLTATDHEAVISGERSTLVRLPAGADGSAFGGWGVRI